MRHILWPVQALKALKENKLPPVWPPPPGLLRVSLSLPKLETLSHRSPVEAYGLSLAPYLDQLIRRSSFVIHICLD